MLREHNEDSHLVDPDLGLFVVADGMGGHQAGEVASRVCVESVQRYLAEHPRQEDGDSTDLESIVRAAIETAHHDIRKMAQDNPAQARMGTTVALMLLRDGQTILAHVGDSRIYRLREYFLQPLTRDHSLVQEQVAAGLVSASEARLSHNRNLITQALGVEEHIEPDIRRVDALAGDIFLLCSDGLNTMVSDRDMETILSELTLNLELAGKVLAQVANDNGGHDNLTLILARLPTGDSPPSIPTRRGLLARLLAWLSGTGKRAAWPN